MSHGKLLSILKMCPYSNFYGHTAPILINGVKPNRNQTFTLVMNMIVKSNLPKIHCVEAVDEVSSSKEASSQQNSDHVQGGGNNDELVTEPE